MRWASITWPAEPVETSSSGVPARTSTVSCCPPGSSVRSTVRRSATRTSTSRAAFLKPGISAETAYRPGAR